MGDFPTPYTVGVKRLVEGDRDAMGVKQDSWAEPVDWPVMAPYPASMEEPRRDDRDVSVSSLAILGPSGHPNEPRDRDRVVVGGVEYEVDGKPRDWSQGPWGWSAGVQVNVKRVEG